MTIAYPRFGPSVQMTGNVCGRKASRSHFIEADADQLLPSVTHVSFDFFDTLFRRRDLFSAKDVFVHVGQRRADDLACTVGEFVVRRQRAEANARVRAFGCGFEEVTLAEIYGEMARMPGFDVMDAPGLVETELAVERLLLEPCQPGAGLYQRAIEAGKTVVVLSDSYFDEAFLRGILAANGMGGASHVLVSSTRRRAKLLGGLFDELVNELGCRPHDIVHIGDNRLTDYTMALGRGVRAVWLPTPRQQMAARQHVGDRPIGDLATSSLLCAIADRTQISGGDDEQATLERLAVENIAVLGYGFAAWLLGQLEIRGVKRVCFAARDGLLMQRFFDLVAGAAGLAVDTRYLQVSRAVLYSTLIYTDPKAARRHFAHSWGRIAIADGLSRLLLTPTDCADALAKHGFDDPEQKIDHADAWRMEAVLEDVWPLVERRNRRRYRLAVDYLRQEGLLDMDEAAIIDIGWHGSLQHCIVRLREHAGIDMDIHGFYLGTFAEPPEATPTYRATGFLVENGQPADINELVRSGPSVIELLHAAPHGSVTGYQRDGKNVRPRFDDNIAERSQFTSLIGPMQELALSFVKDWLASDRRPEITAPDPAIIARIALRPIHAPTRSEARLLGGLMHAADFLGGLKSITGLREWNLATVTGDTLPDGAIPLWRPGFDALKSS